MTRIYLDHNATTPMYPEAIEAVSHAMAQDFANPASQHQDGQRARRVLEEARERIAALLGANLTSPQPDRLIFTASGSESNNLAILGIAQAKKSTSNSLIVSGIEHQCVLEPAEHLLEEGWRVDTVSADENGVIRIDNLPPLLSSETGLVSMMLGNHETGVMQPINQVVRLCRPLGIPVHTDAVQVVGKLKVDFQELGVDALSFAAHKFGGPPGIGALLLRHETPIVPVLFGGHQQQGLRPGTESIPLVLGMLASLEAWAKQARSSQKKLSSLKDRFETGLKKELLNIVVHGEKADRLPQTSNIAFPGLDGQILLMALDMAGVSCSVGSACSSGSTELSPTLKAMGISHDLVASSLRFSIGHTTTETEINEAVGKIVQVCRQMGK